MQGALLGRTDGQVKWDCQGIRGTPTTIVMRPVFPEYYPRDAVASAALDVFMSAGSAYGTLTAEAGPKSLPLYQEPLALWPSAAATMSITISSLPDEQTRWTS